MSLAAQVLDLADGLRAAMASQPVLAPLLAKYVVEAPSSFEDYREPLELLYLAFRVSRCDLYRLDLGQATTLAARLGISVSRPIPMVVGGGGGLFDMLITVSVDGWGGCAHGCSCPICTGSSRRGERSSPRSTRWTCPAAAASSARSSPKPRPRYGVDFCWAWHIGGQQSPR